MNSKLSTIFFGASSYVLPLLDMLHNNYQLTLVVTTEKNPTDAVPKFCSANNIPFLSVEKLDEKTIAEIKKIHAPFAVLADFRLLVRQDVIDLFPKGIINIHPSLLPEYRGPTPGMTALLDGKTTTGVSLMLLDKDLDHGPVLAQEKVIIEPNDTSATLYPKLFRAGTELLEKTLPDYLNGTLQPKAQDHSSATYTDYLTRQSGYIDVNKLPTKEKLHNMIKAYFPWPGVWTLLRLGSGGQAKIIKFLPGNKIQVEGKKPMSYKDFFNGYPQAKEFIEKLVLI